MFKLSSMSPQSAYMLGVFSLFASICSLCIGSSYAKILFNQVGPAGTTTLRLGFSCLILMLVWRPWRIRLSAEHAKIIARYGLTLGAMNFLFYMSLNYIPIGLAIAIEFTGPLALAVISSRRKLDFLFIIIAVIGIALILPLSNAADNISWLGIFYAAAAGVMWAFYIIFGQSASKVWAGHASSYGLFLGFLMALPFGLGQAGGDLLLPSVLGFGLLVGLVSSAIPYSLELISLRTLNRKTMSILLSLEPAIGALAGYFIINENLSLKQIIAILLIVTASIGTATTSYKETAK